MGDAASTGGRGFSRPASVGGNPPGQDVDEPGVRPDQRGGVDAKARDGGLDPGADGAEIPARSGVAAGGEEEEREQDGAPRVRGGEAVQDALQQVAVEVVVGAGAPFHHRLVKFRARAEPLAQPGGEPGAHGGDRRDG